MSHKSQGTFSGQVAHEALRSPLGQPTHTTLLKWHFLYPLTGEVQDAQHWAGYINDGAEAFRQAP